MPSSFSNFAIMVLDVNFTNPYKTADFLFFDDKEDAKKTDNNVVKVKGCLIHAHVDINNLPPSPAGQRPPVPNSVTFGKSQSLRK